MVSGALCRWGLEDDSPTEDEWAHLVRGIAYWTTGDPRLSYAHPPLANALVAYGVAKDDDIPNLAVGKGWEVANSGAVALRWLKRDYESARRKLMEARRAMTWVFLAGIAYAWFWGLRVAGLWAAIAAAAFIGFNPTVIGQARYVTTDLPAGVFIMAAVGEFSRHLAGHGWRTTWLSVPLTLSLAILVKHSAVLLIPVFVVIGFVVAVLRKGAYENQSIATALARYGIHMVATGLTVLIAINAAYRFRDTWLTVEEILEKPEPQYWISRPYKQRLLETVTPLPNLPASLPIPLPYSEVFGLACIKAQNERGYPMGVWKGDVRPKGHPLYFPTMFLYKTPLTILVLVLIGGPIALWKSRMRPPIGPTVVGAVAAFYLLFMMRSNLNMGFRHGLPMEMLWCLVAAAIFASSYRALHRSKWGRRLLLGSLAALVPSAVAAGPNYLGWYNILIGRRAGHAISAVGDDWGQDRKRFVDLVKKYHLRPLYYDHQTETRRLEVQWLGLEYVPLRCRAKPTPGTWIAIHLLPYQVRARRCFPYLLDLDPVFVVNEHVLVFWYPPPGR